MSIVSELALFLTIVSVVVLGSLPQFSLAQQQPTQTNTTASVKPHTNIQTYSNSAFGIRMQYPSNWLKQDLLSNSTSVFYVVFKIPADKPLGLLSISGANYKSSNATLDALVNVRKNQLNHTANVLHLNSSTPATLAGNPAHKIVFTTVSPQGIKFQAMQLISVVGNKSYFITYAVPAAYYATYLPAVQATISSIEINK
jgi:hypothetical protein